MAEMSLTDIMKTGAYELRNSLNNKGLDTSGTRWAHAVQLAVYSDLSLLTWEFPKIGVPYFGDLIIRILLFRVLYWGPLFSETPTCCRKLRDVVKETLHPGHKGWRGYPVRRPSPPGRAS